MKLFLSLIFTVGCYAQSITIPDIDNTAFSLPLTVSSNAFTNLINWIQSHGPSTAWPNAAGVPLNTALAAAITTTTGSCTGVTGASAGAQCTTVSLVSAANLAQCNGLIIDSESMVVYSVNSGANTALVIRGMLATTKATHSNGAAVTVTRVGDGGCQIKAFIADGTYNVVYQTRADATSAAAQASLTAALASIATVAAGAIQ